MVASLRRGDQVVTQGGLIGKVTKVKEDNEIEVEVSDGVKVRVVQNTIAQVLSKQSLLKTSRKTTRLDKMLQIALWKRLVIWFLCIGGLLLALPNAFYSRVESFNDAKLTSETAEGWPSFLPSSLVNLGLDLRGRHLLAEVQVADVYEQRMAALCLKFEICFAMNELKWELYDYKGEPNELKIKLSKPEAINDAVKLVETLAKPVSSIGSVGKLDLEVIGENSDLIVKLSEAERRATDDRTMQQALEIIRRRIDEVGTREPTIQRQGTERILIKFQELDRHLS